MFHQRFGVQASKVINYVENCVHWLHRSFYLHESSRFSNQIQSKNGTHHVAKGRQD